MLIPLRWGRAGRGRGRLEIASNARHDRTFTLRLRRVQWQSNPKGEGEITRECLLSITRGGGGLGAREAKYYRDPHMCSFYLWGIFRRATNDFKIFLIVLHVCVDM